MCVDRPLCVRVRSEVLEVLLDAPQRVSALLQLGHLGVCQGHVDDVAHAAAVQHAGQRQEDLVTDAVHVLWRNAPTQRLELTVDSHCTQLLFVMKQLLLLQVQPGTLTD